VSRSWSIAQRCSTPPGDVRIEDRPVPSPGPREVLVEIATVGVCGSDAHYYEHGRIGSHVVGAPLVR
jgi:L-iditol 2-dehydrogenase